MNHTWFFRNLKKYVFNNLQKQLWQVQTKILEVSSLCQTTLIIGWSKVMVWSFCPVPVCQRTTLWSSLPLIRDLSSGHGWNAIELTQFLCLRTFMVSLRPKSVLKILTLWSDPPAASLSKRGAVWIRVSDDQEIVWMVESWFIWNGKSIKRRR